MGRCPKHAAMAGINPASASLREAAPLLFTLQPVHATGRVAIGKAKYFADIYTSMDGKLRRIRHKKQLYTRLARLSNVFSKKLSKCKLQV
jgi:hypothetical protein